MIGTAGNYVLTLAGAKSSETSGEVLASATTTSAAASTAAAATPAKTEDSGTAQTASVQDVTKYVDNHKHCPWPIISR